MAKRDTRGFSDDQIGYLVGMAQQIHAPSDFANEVQDRLNSVRPTPQDDENQREISQKESLDNLSVPQEPVIPETPKATRPAKSPNWDDLANS